MYQDFLAVLQSKYVRYIQTSNGSSPPVSSVVNLRCNLIDSSTWPDREPLIVKSRTPQNKRNDGTIIYGRAKLIIYSSKPERREKIFEIFKAGSKTGLFQSRGYVVQQKISPSIKLLNFDLISVEQIAYLRLITDWHHSKPVPNVLWCNATRQVWISIKLLISPSRQKIESTSFAFSNRTNCVL